MKYTVLALGGTFDHFHAGHRAFLKYAASLAEQLVIGLTKPEITLHKDLYDQLEPYDVREKAVADFCKDQNISCEITALTDVYGPTTSDARIEALCVTPETVTGAEAINNKRISLSLTALHVEKAPLLFDEVGEIISSKRIRKGQIDREGNVYKNIFAKNLKLTERQRSYFSKPHGTIVTEPRENQSSAIICLVGDSTFETFFANNWQYTAAIIDFKKKRVEYQPSSKLLDLIQVRATNPAGEITVELVAKIEEISEKKWQHLLVMGEEDLAAVAAVLLLPLGSLIYYGQPDVGIVEVLVTETIKNDFYSVLKNI